MKRAVSIIIAIALVIAGIAVYADLSIGGEAMRGLESTSGTSVAEYYYQAMGVCMEGLSYFAVALLWGLAWIIAAWPDNQGIIAALRQRTPDVH
ncbi:MAG: hypothetical protein AB9886_02035 [Candidatus Cryosericum sp.]